MGTSIAYVESEFYMSSSNFYDAVQIANEVFKGQYELGCIEDLLDELGFEAEEYDYSGDIITLDWTGNQYKYSDETLKVFNVIAPYVRKGSYIHMYDEDGVHFRWYFDGKNCIEQPARYVFDEIGEEED